MNNLPFRYKSLKFVSQEQRDAAIKFISSMFKNIKEENNSRVVEESQVAEAGPSTSKKSRFVELQDVEADVDPTSFETEFQRYLTSRVDLSEDSGKSG
jgi:hypothetical protein